LDDEGGLDTKDEKKTGEEMGSRLVSGYG